MKPHLSTKVQKWSQLLSNFSSPKNHQLEDCTMETSWAGALEMPYSKFCRISSVGFLAGHVGLVGVWRMAGDGQFWTGKGSRHQRRFPLQAGEMSGTSNYSPKENKRCSFSQASWVSIQSIVTAHKRKIMLKCFILTFSK